MLFRKRPRALASNVELTSPVFPGRIGDLVQSVTVHPQEVVTLDITNGLSPLFVILKVAVTGFFHKTNKTMKYRKHKQSQVVTKATQ